MVIYQIHVNRLTVLEAEHHAPVPGGAHAPLACSVPLQGVQSEAGGIGATGVRRFLHSKQDAPKPGNQIRWEPGSVIPFVERAQPLVADLHGSTVARRVTRRHKYGRG